MFVPNLPMHESLLVRSRVRPAVSPLCRTQVWEFAWLIAMGVAAASAATFWDWSLRIPGHAILRTVFPMTLGLALVPRHGSGFVMGLSALGTTFLYNSAGHGMPGLGAMTSLALFGPLADVILWRARRGWLLFGGFAIAGVLCNLMALFARGGGRLAGAGRAATGLSRGARIGRGMGGGLGAGGGLGLGGGGGHGTEALGATMADPWWSYAPLSYLVCGLLAGLVCAAIWFAARPRGLRPAKDSQP